MHQSQAISRFISVPRDPPLQEEPIESVLTHVPNRELLLTSRTGVVINCDRGRDNYPDPAPLEPGFRASVRWLRNSTDPIFSGSARTLVDIGCGEEGTPYANALEAQISGTRVQWVDRNPSVISVLDKPVQAKHCASAESLPFHAQTFDIALISGVVESGLSRLPDMHMPGGDPTGFKIVKESARVLSPGGILMISFSCGTSDPGQTLNVLKDAGFVTISHIHRVLWWGGLPTDLYACRKAS